MAQKKLGRGLGALVSLAPASEDGTARLEDAIRAEPPEASVLALSGRSVEEFFRVAGVEPVGPRRPPEPPPPPPMPPPETLAPRSESCSEPEPVDDLPEVPGQDAPRAETGSPTPPVPPNPDDGRQYLLFDPPVGAVAEGTAPAAGDAGVSPRAADRAATGSRAGDAGAALPPAREPASPRRGPAETPPPVPATVSEPAGSDAVEFVDDLVVADVAFDEIVVVPSAPSGAAPRDPLDRGGFDPARDAARAPATSGANAPTRSVPTQTSASDAPRAVPPSPAAPSSAPAASAPGAGPTTPANRLAPEPPPPAAPPSVLLVDDVVIVDDSVGGIVLPDVDLE